MSITYEQIKQHPDFKIYIQKADDSLKALGFTEHSFSHVVKVAETAGSILQTLGAPERTIELTKIAGYLHDIGNLVNRDDHSQSGAVLAFMLLHDMQMPAAEIAEIVTAIGNHDEDNGLPLSDIAAAIILADKSDVRRSRVRNTPDHAPDIHDRVNYSVTHSALSINEMHTTITLDLKIDTAVSSVMSYFEIFMGRMHLCQKAAHKLGLQFHLVINDQKML